MGEAPECNMDSTKKIPLVDFSPFLVDNEGIFSGDAGAAPTAAQENVAAQIDRICRDHGFLCLTGFGMTPELRDSIFSAAQELFDLPTEHKTHQLARIDPASNMGYAPLFSESVNRSRPPEIKEAFNLRFPPKHNNKLEGVPDSFQAVCDRMLDFYKGLSYRYSTACAMALGLPPDFFSRTLNVYDQTTIRCLHYPPCDFEETATGTNAGDLSKRLRIGEHTDFGLFTFLLVLPKHGPDGLQLKAVAGAEVGGAAGGEEEGWIDVVLPTETTTDKEETVLIVNTGALAARWTNDTWKATAHRVIVPNAEAAARSRYSIACFVDPDAKEMVKVHESFGTPKYSPITSDAYLMEKLQSMMNKQ